MNSSISINSKPKPIPTLITDLPRDLILQIASYLNMKDISNLAMSSSIWKYLIYSTPSIVLNLDEECRNSQGLVISRKLTKYLGFIERIFLFRDGIDLDKFSVNCRIDSIQYQLETWVLNSIRLKVQDLGVCIRLADPSSRFLRKLLSYHLITVLELDLNRGYLKLGRYVSLTKLKSLALISVEVNGASLSKLLSNHCVCLKSLFLNECLGFESLEINSLSLESFGVLSKYGRLTNISLSCPKLLDVNFKFHSPINLKRIHLIAPNLQFFKWYGGVAKQCNFEQFDDLKVIHVSIPIRMIHHEYVTRRSLLQFGIELFGNLVNAEEVYVCSVSIQILVQLIKKGTLSLPNVGILRVSTHFRDEVDSSYFWFMLCNCPTLTELEIDQETFHPFRLALSQKDCHEIREMKLDSRLETLAMMVFAAGEANYDLVWYLVNEGIKLDSIIIRYKKDELEIANGLKERLRRETTIPVSCRLLP